jgi:hypothetical protein
MKRTNIKLMNEEEFEVYTRKTIEALGEDVSGFFTVIRDTFEYFTASDDINVTIRPVSLI